jgi:hypothetical protein
MKNNSWPSFSFTDLLRPPDGWRAEHAILTTYSADLVVIVTALLALTGSDLDHRRTGSRVELVKAIDALRGRVRVLAQRGRVTIPNTQQPILKLLDKFLLTVETDENVRSWHPKVALVRHQNIDNEFDRQWRVWLGSRNLTRAMNWEAGLVLVSRSDGHGVRVAGLAELGAALAGRANLPTLPAADVIAELAALTWECPPGSEVQNVRLMGPGLGEGLPKPLADVERVFVVSPFLDAKTVRAVAGWGNVETRRTLVSTALALQRLRQKDETVFSGYGPPLVLPLPDLPGEGAELLDEAMPAATETAESEEVPPAGLHAKLLFAASRSRRQLWLGSANATDRGWEGRNFEAVAELLIARDAAEAIEDFVASCEPFTPNALSPAVDKDEEALEDARKILCSQWSLRQRVGEDETEVVASSTSPLQDPTIRLEVAALGGGAWHLWPRDKDSILLSGVRRRQRGDFMQVRVSRGDRMCAWLHVAPCEPPPDEDRDRALIAEYLDPHTFLVWLRSVLADRPANAAGGDWDADPDAPGGGDGGGRSVPAVDLIPTLEEILRAWARDSSAFASADEKVRSYLHEIERHAREHNSVADVEMLEGFRRTWETLAAELR